MKTRSISRIYLGFHARIILAVVAPSGFGLFKVVRQTILTGAVIVLIALFLRMGISYACPMANKLADIFSGI